MDFRDEFEVEQAIELLSKELSPGEKIIVLGTPVNEHIAAKWYLASIFVITALLMILGQIFAAIITSLIFFASAFFILWISRNPLTVKRFAYFALTEDRLLEVTKNSVTVVFHRDRITSIDPGSNGEKVKIRSPGRTLVLRAVTSLPEISG